MKTTNPTTQINRRPNTQNKYQDCKNNSTVNKSNKKPKHNNITIAWEINLTKYAHKMRILKKRLECSKDVTNNNHS